MWFVLSSLNLVLHYYYMPPTLGGKKKLCGKRNDKCHKKETENASEQTTPDGATRAFRVAPRHSAAAANFLFK